MEWEITTRAEYFFFFFFFRPRFCMFFRSVVAGAVGAARADGEGNGAAVGGALRDHLTTMLTPRQAAGVEEQAAPARNPW